MKQTKNNKIKQNIKSELSLLTFQENNSFKEKLRSEFIANSKPKKRAGNLLNILNSINLKVLGLILLLLSLVIPYSLLINKSNVSADEIYSNLYQNNSQISLVLIEMILEENIEYEKLDNIKNYNSQDKSYSYSETLIISKKGPLYEECSNLGVFEDEYAILHSYEYIANNNLHYKLKTHEPDTDLTNYISHFGEESIFFNISNQTAKLSDNKYREIKKNFSFSENIELYESGDSIFITKEIKKDCGKVIIDIEIDNSSFEIKDVSYYLSTKSQENSLVTLDFNYEYIGRSENIDLNEVFRYDLDVDLTD